MADVRKFAELMVRTNNKEVNDLLKILEEEYGIFPCKELPDKELMSSELPTVRKKASENCCVTKKKY